MAQGSPTPPEDQRPKAPEGISSFVTKVLDQLAISAWLPAAMLIGIGSLLVQLNRDENLNLADAFQNLTNQKSWFIVVVLLFALVLTTMVTQAFSFGVIRFLEGYWGPSRFLDILVKWRVRRHVNRACRCRERTEKLELALFMSARQKLKCNEDPRHVDVWDDQVNRVPKDKRRQQDKSVIAAANAINWRERGDPVIAALFERAKAKMDDYPTKTVRILPTTLGNVLRSSEDRLQLEGSSLERFVMDNYRKIPTRLLAQHDQFRDRLDMYSMLVVVFWLLAFSSLPLLIKAGTPLFCVPPLVGLSVLGTLGLLSYRAAIASARGYGSALISIKVVVETPAVVSRSDSDRT